MDENLSMDLFFFSISVRENAPFPLSGSSKAVLPMVTIVFAILELWLTRVEWVSGEHASST